MKKTNLGRWPWWWSLQHFLGFWDFWMSKLQHQAFEVSPSMWYILWQWETLQRWHFAVSIFQSRTIYTLESIIMAIYCTYIFWCAFCMSKLVILISYLRGLIAHDENCLHALFPAPSSLGCPLLDDSWPVWRLKLSNAVRNLGVNWCVCVCVSHHGHWLFLYLWRQAGEL